MNFKRGLNGIGLSNTSTQQYFARRQKVKTEKENKQKLESLETEVVDLREQIDQILDTLNQNGLSNG